MPSVLASTSLVVQLTNIGAPPPGAQPPHAPRRCFAPSRAAPGVPSGEPVSAGHPRYGNCVCIWPESVDFGQNRQNRQNPRFSSPRYDKFPYRWWPTDTGPPEAVPGAARDGAARRRGAWGGCSPGGGAHARFPRFAEIWKIGLKILALLI